MRRATPVCHPLKKVSWNEEIRRNWKTLEYIQIFGHNLTNTSNTRKEKELVVLKAMFVQSVQDGYTFIVATMKYNVKLIDEVGDDVDDDI